MKSKHNTHSQQASGKNHTVSILISLTESRNMASVTHHLPSLLSSSGEDGEMGGWAGTGGGGGGGWRIGEEEKGKGRLALGDTYSL